MKLFSKYWAYGNHILGIKARQIKENGINLKYNNSIWFLGCSHVHGTGVDSSNTVTTYLSNLSKQSVINLGHPGSGPMMVEHQLSSLLKKYKPSAVVIAWPNFSSRWQSYEKNFPDPVLWMPFCLDGIVQHNDHYGSKSLWPDSWHQYKNLIMTNTLKDVNIQSYNNVHEMLKKYKIVEFQYAEDESFNISKPCYPWLDLGSDNLHPGPKTHKKVADWVWSKLNDI